MQGVEEIILGGFVGSLIALGVVLMALFFIGLYVYFSWAWMVIARKLGYKKAWLAWIPIANIAMILQLGGFNWLWVLLILIPFVGWIALFVIGIIATWRIFEARKYPGWFSLSMIIPQVGWILYGIALGFVAWKDKRRVELKRKIRRR